MDILMIMVLGVMLVGLFFILKEKPSKRGNKSKRSSERPFANLDFAEHKRADSKFICSRFYGKSDGSGLDLEKVMKMYRKAVENHIAVAESQFNVGVYYDRNKNYTEAVKWYLKAAEHGIVEAQFNLGMCYLMGEGVRQDYIQAVKWYRKAAEQGLALAQYELGVCYSNGEGVRKDLVKAAEWYLKAAEQGNVNAQINMGACYAYGNGVMPDYDKAIEWFRKAAKQGHVKAQELLRSLDEEEAKEKKTQNEAARKQDLKSNNETNMTDLNDIVGAVVTQFRKRAEQGEVEIQYELGVLYYTGRGVEKDFTKAVEWFKKAANQGHVEGQLDLGVCYNNGEGVKRDPAKAAEWWKKAAEQGNAMAQSNLAGYYYRVEKDLTEAVKWWRKAAEQGNAPAQYELGLCYQCGEGVEKNIMKAMEWLQKAADQGYNTAKKAMFSLKRNLD